MKLHRTLKNYLFDHRLYISPIGDRYEVIDQNHNFNEAVTIEDEAS